MSHATCLHVSSNAACDVARFYENGMYVHADAEKAFKLYKYAAGWRGCDAMGWVEMRGDGMTWDDMAWHGM